MEKVEKVSREYLGTSPRWGASLCTHMRMDGISGWQMGASLHILQAVSRAWMEGVIMFTVLCAALFIVHPRLLSSFLRGAEVSQFVDIFFFKCQELLDPMFESLSTQRFTHI